MNINILVPCHGGGVVFDYVACGGMRTFVLGHFMQKGKEKEN